MLASNDGGGGRWHIRHGLLKYGCYDQRWGGRYLQTNASARMNMELQDGRSLAMTADHRGCSTSQGCELELTIAASSSALLHNVTVNTKNTFAKISKQSTQVRLFDIIQSQAPPEQVHQNWRQLVIYVATTFLRLAR